jgi:hypothetical protein
MKPMAHNIQHKEMCSIIIWITEAQDYLRRNGPQVYLVVDNSDENGGRLMIKKEKLSL